MSHVSGNVRWFMRHRSLKEQAVAKGDAFIRQLVIDAYSQPHYATPEMQQRAAGDFADKAMLACENGSS